MRAIIIKESLRQSEVPASFPGTLHHQFRHQLDENADTEITILEYLVPTGQALEAGMLLAENLLTTKYYAHLLDGDHMLIAFPDCLLRLARGDDNGQRQAQAIGALFDIPVSQMRFLEMFDADHPDAPLNPSASITTRQL